MELAKKEDRKNKKKKLQEHKWKQNKQTLTISVNTINALKRRKRGIMLVRLRYLTMIRKITMPVTVVSHKTSINLWQLQCR